VLAYPIQNSRAGTHVVDVLSAVVALPWRLCRGVLVRDGVWIDAMHLILVHVLHAGARDQKRSRLLRVVLGLLLIVPAQSPVAAVPSACTTTIITSSAANVSHRKLPLAERHERRYRCPCMHGWHSS
jgi:hypothetical protein